MLDISTVVVLLLAATSAVKDCASTCPPTQAPPPPPPPNNWSYCIPASATDLFGTHMLEGSYKVAGLEGAGNIPYSGNLHISAGGPSLLLSRQVGPKTTYGTARYMRCGTETRFLFLHVEYNTSPHKKELLCSIPPFQQLPNRARLVTATN